jgi:hypothetical protein
MKRRRRCCQSAALAILLIGSFSVFRATDASALPGCPGSQDYDYVSNAWLPSDDFLAGIRAPIQARIDGAVCTGGTELGFAAAWIAINKLDGSSITQIGFLHVYDPDLGVGKVCRFWAIDGGTAHNYGCGSQTDDNFIWFKIERQYNSDTKSYFYNIYDCGASGYTNCTSKNATQAAYANAFGVVAAETDYGRGNCTVRIMGSYGDKQNFGNTGYPISFQHDQGGSWGTKNMLGSPAYCGEYGGNFSDTTMGSWDGRNNS